MKPLSFTFTVFNCNSSVLPWAVRHQELLRGWVTMAEREDCESGRGQGCSSFLWSRSFP